MEFKSYGEINLDEAPIAVLGCGHFFTGETLDGLVGMSRVYTTDKFGNFDGLQELSGQLTTIPTCPDCRVPIRQFATRRYNRVVNKAVLDEISKRFLIDGSQKLKDLEERVAVAEKGLPKEFKAKQLILERFVKEATELSKTTNAEQQPMKKLVDAAIALQRESTSLPQRLANLSLTPTSPPLPNHLYDRTVTLGAFGLQIRIGEILFKDRLTLWAERPAGHTLTIHHELIKQTKSYLAASTLLIKQATAARLPRIAVPAILSQARTVQIYQYYRRRVISLGITTSPETANPQQPDQTKKEPDKTDEKDCLESARESLAKALKLIDTFPGGEVYRAEIKSTARLFEGPRYETVTPEELAAIKRAMVSGSRGIATHSGHWYTCRNGHPVSLSFPLSRTAVLAN